MIAVDTETTGLDLNHGAKPFFVTIKTPDRAEPFFWEWSVDPMTREPQIPLDDKYAITEHIREVSSQDPETGLVIGQNIRFDIKALDKIGIGRPWPWDRTRDTLLAGHILASNQKHDLTAMVLTYLNEDILPWEKKVEEAVKKARSMVQQARNRKKRLEKKAGVFPGEGSLFDGSDPEGDLAPFSNTHHETNGYARNPEDMLAEWRIASEDDPQMPSATAKTWQHDYWLPRAVAKALKYPANHPWWTVTRDYANIDSLTTYHLWEEMERRLRDNDLWEMYIARVPLLRAILKLECRGATFNEDRMNQLQSKYQVERKCLRELLLGIARHRGYNLTIPDGATNHSLTYFLFGRVKGDEPVSANEDHLNLSYLQDDYTHFTEQGNPSMKAAVLEEFAKKLPERSQARLFLDTLLKEREKADSISALQGYAKFCLPDGKPGQMRLYPSVNPTGSAHLRFSHTNPNTANISTQDDEEGHSHRYCFGPAEGREWWSLDYSNIERRIPVYEAKEPSLMALFERPDDPPYYGSEHALVAHILYPREFEQCRGKDGQLDGRLMKKLHLQIYKKVKNFDFATQYQAGDWKADTTAGVPGAKKMVIERFSKLNALNSYWVKFAEKRGYVETLPDRLVNPRRGYPIWCTRTERDTISPTIPLNYHVSGSAMWLMSMAMIGCQAQLDEWEWREGLDAGIVLQVHDELVFDFPFAPDQGNLPRILILREIMAETGPQRFGIPTPVGIDYHPKNWNETEPLRMRA